MPFPDRTTPEGRSRRSEKQSYVYIICHKTEANEFVGPVKVGYSDNPVARLYELQCGNPGEITLAAQILVPARFMAREIEQCFHDTQASNRLRGEWFDFTPGQAIFILCLAVQVLLPARVPNLTKEDFDRSLDLMGVTAALEDKRFHLKPGVMQ